MRKIKICIDGLTTGMVLQLAVGPVFFLVMNIALMRTLFDGLSAVAGVVVVDYFYITLSVIGVGKALEKPKLRLFFGIISAAVLALYGILMIHSVFVAEKSVASGYPVTPGSDLQGSFLSAFLLTLSSPLTILFWTGLFTAKTVAHKYTGRELVIFAFFAGLSTLLFLGFTVLLSSGLRASFPTEILRWFNLPVGIVLVLYSITGIIQTLRFKTVSG